MSLLSELQRRNVLKVGAAYLVVAWLLIQVAATVAPQLGTPEWTPRLVTLLLMLGFPIALLVAWFLERTPEGLKVEKAMTGNKRIVAVALALAALAVGWFLRERPSGPADGGAADARSVAVLPFVNMSADAENEYFADGLSEEILNALVTITDLRVTGRTSSFQFKGRNEDLRRIGEQLGVANVVEGSVRRAGDQVRITAQLVRTADGFHLWSASYDRDVKDTFQIQLDIAHNVTRALDVVLDEAQRAQLEQSGVRDVEAFIAFQKARELYDQAHDDYIAMDKLHAGYAEFERAIAIEPGFGTAYYVRTDLYAHVLGVNTAPAAELAAVHAKYLADLTEAARLPSSPQQRALIELDRMLISDDWRALPRQVEAVLAAPGCAEPVWADVVVPFVDAARYFDWRKSLLKCDPLDRTNLRMATIAGVAANQPAAALQLIEAFDARAGSKLANCSHVGALLLLGRVDEARAQARVPDPRTRDFCELTIAASVGDATAARASLQRWLEHPRAATSNSADFRLAGFAMVGDRAQANAVAESLDRNPAGPMMLATAAMTCMCGAPFDIERTPRFKARLAEAGWSWPPPDIMQFKTKDW